MRNRREGEILGFIAYTENEKKEKEEDEGNFRRGLRSRSTKDGWERRTMNSATMENGNGRGERVWTRVEGDEESGNSWEGWGELMRGYELMRGGLKLGWVILGG